MQDFSLIRAAMSTLRQSKPWRIATGQTSHLRAGPNNLDEPSNSALEPPPSGPRPRPGRGPALADGKLSERGAAERQHARPRN